MQGKSRLYLLLETIEHSEFKTFIKQIQPTEQVKFLNHLYKYHPEYDDIKTIEEKYSKRNAKTPAALKRMRTRLITPLEDFLIQQHLSKNPTERKQLLYTIFQEKKADKLFEDSNPKLIEERSKPPINAHDFLKLAELHHQRYFHSTSDKLTIHRPHLLKAHEYLYYFFMLRTFKYICDWHFLQKIHFQKAEKEVMDILLPWIESRPFNKHSPPLLQIYQEMVLLITQLPHKEKYEKIKVQFLSQKEMLPPSEFSAIVSLFFNYVLNGASPFFIRESLYWFNFGINASIFSSNGIIPSTIFINAVIASSEIQRLKNIQIQKFKLLEPLPKHLQAQSIFDTYQKQLNQPNAPIYRLLAKAYLTFSEQSYNNAIRILQLIKTQKGVRLKMHAHSLQLRAYFEADFSQQTISSDYDIKDFMKTYKIYIERNQDKGTGNSPLTKFLAESNLNFLKFVKELYQLKEQCLLGEITRKQKKIHQQGLLNTINNTPKLICRYWLKNQVHQL